VIGWSVTHIGLVYYLGLATLTALAGIVWLLLARRSSAGFAAVLRAEAAVFWRRMFSVTVLLLALLGALSVKFYGCSVTEYDHLLSSPAETVWRGLEQVAVGAKCLGYALCGWLLAHLLLLTLITPRPHKVQP